MVRTATKRKSEGDIPDRRKKPKATASTSAKNEPSSQEQLPSSQGLLVEQPTPVYVKKDRPKSRKSAPARIDDEFFEDEGRMETHQFIALVGLQMKKKKKTAKATGDFNEKFKASIESEEQGLKTRIEKLGVVAKNEDEGFIDIFARAYNISRPAQPPKSALAPAPPSELYFSTLYPRTRQLVESARSIVDQFVATSDAAAKLEASGGLAQQVKYWEKENVSVASLMALGHKVGVQKVEAMLEGKEGPDLEEDDAQFVGMLYGVGEDENGGHMGVGQGMMWGRLVKKQFKAGKRLYKTTAGEVGG